VAIFRGAPKSIMAQCNFFDIGFSNETIDNKLLLRELKNSLENKFSLIASRNVRDTTPCRCALFLEVTETDFPSAKNDDGSVRGETKLVGIKYSVDVRGRQFSKKLNLLYDTTNSMFKYSDHVRKNKEDSNMVESLAEDIFLSVVEQSSHLDGARQ
jgi:hypothetical protein